MGMPIGSSWAAACVAAAIAAPATPSRVAVLDAQIDGESAEHVQEALTAGLLKGLQTAGLDAVGAQEACIEAACREAVAVRTEASHVVHARVNVTGTDYRFALELVDPATGDVVQRSEGSCEICTYQEAAEAIAERAEGLKPQPAPEPTTIKLIVRSNPNGATVHIDGEAAGLTPYEGEIEPGDHEVSVAKDGYEPIEQRVRADAEPARLQLDLLRRRYRPGPIGYAGVAIAAAGLLTAVGGVVLLVIDERDVENNCSGEQVDAAGNCEFRYDTLAGGATMTALGLAGVGAGAGLLVWDHRRSRAKLTAGLGINGIRLQARF